MDDQVKYASIRPPPIVGGGGIFNKSQWSNILKDPNQEKYVAKTNLDYTVPAHFPNRNDLKTLQAPGDELNLDKAVKQIFDDKSKAEFMAQHPNYDPSYRARQSFQQTTGEISSSQRMAREMEFEGIHPEDSPESVAARGRQAIPTAAKVAAAAVVLLFVLPR
jgi:hypothetical protein